MLKKTYQFKGLDVRSNPLTRDPDSASDMCNVHLDSQRQLRKRFGFSEFMTPSSTVKKVIPFVGGNKLLAQTTTYLANITGATWEIVPNAGTTPTWNGKVNHAEYNKTMYFTDEEDNTDLYKYDNYALYRAGMPQPVVTGMSGVTYWWRVFFEFHDGQGVSVFGDYFQFQSDIVTLAVAYPSTEGFYYKYGKVNGLQTINSGNLTLNVNAVLGHNYAANDYVRIYMTSPFRVKMVKIDSATVSTITFNAADIGTDSFSFTDLAPVEYRVSMHAFRSANETYGYQSAAFSGFWGATGYGPLNDQASPMNVNLAGGVTDVEMEDFYDTTRLKGLPPKCRYISFLNNIMVLKRKVPQEVAFSSEAEVEESSFYWSDLSVGSCIETFNPFDYELVGKAEEGEITGGLGDIIFKEKTPYQIIGNLPLKTYAIRPLNANGVGCISHQSVILLDNGCLFISPKGVYWVGQNQLPKELTDRIEPMFTEDATGLEFENAISFNDSKNEKIWVYVPSSVGGNEVVFVMDYYHKEWFIYKQIPATNGICIFNDDIYYASATKVYKRNSAYNDDGVAINAWYATAWQNAGEPSLKKKFTRFLVLALKGTSWVCNLISQINWKAVDHTDVTVQLDTDHLIVDKALDVAQPYSMRFIMKNNVLNEGLDVTGYEYEYEYTQKRPKGEL